MIRRNPTLIPMSDMDVQDIRNLIAHKKAGKGKDTYAAPANTAQGGQGYAAAEEAKRKREGMSRDERLGL
ncbi:uncharacterized protein STEHIDRAFT_162133 [Stereum hirsutum FP-91666 SS1]|uniref:uncharacterized protein n=1 Tax=Stereum hirsutum (strain FP-91666) TaxID=721885 RepID=UPI000444A3E7|nr:uncharacterized protein STEHIDRAFT_162133 [Stereum hirsutum FP-91666 SS1]EIM81142.1 hypothetical protein STEHIDRAFT_162133 [Stereum hirsutum FP-91666 SS1]